jgi:hypothetical protein
MTGEEIAQHAAQGRGGQRISVFPDLDVVAVTLGGGIDSGRVLDLLGTALVQSGHPLPESREGQRALEAALSEIARPPQPTPPDALPPLAAEVSGRTWRFPANALGIETLQITFDDTADAGFRMSFFGGLAPRAGRIGLDGVLRMFPGEDEVTAGMRGRWTTGRDFAAEYDGIAQIDAFDLALHFDGDTLPPGRRSAPGPCRVVMRGSAGQ